MAWECLPPAYRSRPSASYTLQNTDYQGIIIFDSGATVNVTLNSNVTSNFQATILNLGSGAIALATSDGSAINGGPSSLTLASGQGVQVFFANRAWLAYAGTTVIQIVPQSIGPVAHSGNSYKLDGLFTTAATDLFSKSSAGRRVAYGHPGGTDGTWNAGKHHVHQRNRNKYRRSDVNCSGGVIVGGLLSSIFDLAAGNPVQGEQNQFGALSGYQTGVGEGLITPAAQYEESILSGDPTKTAQAMAPEISANQNQTQQFKNQTAEFSPRSGGTAASVANADTSGRSNLIDLLGKEQSGAASHVSERGERASRFRLPLTSATKRTGRTVA